MSVTDKKGLTPVTWAKRLNKGPVIDLLVKHGATPLVDNSQKNKGGAKTTKQPAAPV